MKTVGIILLIGILVGAVIYTAAIISVAKRTKRRNNLKLDYDKKKASRVS